MADAGIDDEWGLGAATVEQMAFFNSINNTAAQMSLHNNQNGMGGQDAQMNGSSGNKGMGVAADIEVNLDGQVPARAVFDTGAELYDVSSSRFASAYLVSSY